MLASILQAHPTLHGVLFDLPNVVKGAPPLLEGAGVANRCQVIGGDAFTAVPAGYDTYLLSRVIHDWDDEHAIVLLSRCHQAMAPRGKVLLVERVIRTGSTGPSNGKKLGSLPEWLRPLVVLEAGWSKRHHDRSDR